MKKERKPWSPLKRRVLFILALSSSVLGVLIIMLAGYVGFVFLSYSRIGNQDLTVDHRSQKNMVNLDTELTAVTYNIGFGAYSQDFTFFLDTGYDEAGNSTCGSGSTAKSYEEFMFNTEGSINLVKNLNPDFVMFQEVDTYSTRSYQFNQDKYIMDQFSNYDHVYCVNAHMPFLPYPIGDMFGVVNGGLTTISRYHVDNAIRKEYTVTTSISKIFDLDRCFSIQVIPTSNNHKLYIVNSHMSAYGDGAIVRKKQIEELRNFILEVSKADDYLVIGGDFNHDLLTYNPDYDYTVTNRPFNENKKNPDWISPFFSEDGSNPLVSGTEALIRAADNEPTCRNNDIEWIEGKTYVCAVDGFVHTSNIDFISIETIRTGKGNKNVDAFAYSDHQPVVLKFKLSNRTLI